MSRINIENPEELIEYLRQHHHIDADKSPVVSTLYGGVSNCTVLLECPDGISWVLKQAHEKLRTPVDWFCSPERVHREALGMRWLQQLAPAGSIVPLVFEDHENHIIAMQAVPNPHENWKASLMQGNENTICLNHVEQFGNIIGQIHQKSSEQKEELLPLFVDQTFFENLRLEPYYKYTASQVPEASRFFDELIGETQTIQLTLVHGDFSPKNILIYKDRLILVDHEVIHYGDPAFDIGFSMTHLLSKAHYFHLLRKRFAQAAFHYWKTYISIAGEKGFDRGFEQRAVKHTIACMLARVAGRSPLEYFDEPLKEKQKRVLVSSLIPSIPRTMPELIERFMESL